MKKFRHKKELGQHFLKDRNIAAKIAGLGEIEKTDYIWEVGPGNGILTRELLNYTGKVTAFEIDDLLYDRLEQEFGDKLILIKEDVLKADWEKLIPSGMVKLIANIPYQITTPLLLKIIRYRKHFSKIVIMMQKEVADRLRAQPGTKDYSFLSIKNQFYFEVKYGFTVKPHLFIPSPKVNSAVISLIPREDVYELIDPDFFWKLVDAGFRSRRKTLRNNLKYILNNDEIRILETKTGIDLKRRSETLSIKEFITLYNDINPLCAVDLHK